MILEIRKSTERSIKVLTFMTILCGVVYPVCITLVANLIAPLKAKGSLIYKNDAVIGSELISQNFQGQRYFHSRPSASDYNTLPSGASNQGFTSLSLKDAIKKRQDAYGPDAPADLVTSSASGLDPHISPSSARAQMMHIANARKLDSNQQTSLERLISSTIEPPSLGFIGPERVNVLKLNIALDREFP